MNNYANYYSQRRAPQTATMQPSGGFASAPQTPAYTQHMQGIQHGFPGSITKQPGGLSPGTPSRPTGIGHYGPGSWAGQPGHEQYLQQIAGGGQRKIGASRGNNIPQLLMGGGNREDGNSINNLIQMLLGQQLQGIPGLNGLGGMLGLPRGYGVVRQQQPTGPQRVNY